MKRFLPKRSARLYLVGFVFVMLVATSAILSVLGQLAQRMGISFGGALFDVLYLPAVSVVIGTLLSAVLAELVIRPYKKLTEATQQIAQGNFAARVELKGPFEIEKLADSFNTMAAELSSIETMRSDFVSNVSHEFKTPVASIRGFAKLLKKDAVSPELRNEYLDTIIRESDRLTQLTSNVLLLSKIERQQILTDKRTFALDEQLRRAMLVLQPQWEAKRLDVSADLPKMLCVGSEELLMQVWMNLLTNAIKFTHEGGSVMITLYRERGAIAVKVQDTGVGMDADTIRHVFDKFYQGDASHSVEGNGLGLSLVKRIVEMSGGQLTVESEPGVGTAVYVRLPDERQSI